MPGRPASSLLYALIVTVALLPFGGVSAYWHTVSADSASRMQGPTPLVLEPNARMLHAMPSERRPAWHPPLAQQGLELGLQDAATSKLLASVDVLWTNEVVLVALGRLQLEGG